MEQLESRGLGKPKETVEHQDGKTEVDRAMDEMSIEELDPRVEDAYPREGCRRLLGHRREPEAVARSAALGLPAGRGHQHQLHQLHPQLKVGGHLFRPLLKRPLGLWSEAGRFCGTRVKKGIVEIRIRLGVERKRQARGVALRRELDPAPSPTRADRE
jgi:hypothetical protein